MHFAWIDELHRVIKPNGIVIFTTHGERYKTRLKPHERTQFEADQLVVRDSFSEGKKHFSAFHPNPFVRERLLQKFDVLRHMTELLDYKLGQDLWVARKR